jgi:CBS domain-containing protein
MASEVPRVDTLGQLMSKPVITIDANQSLHFAAETMVMRDIGAVVVVEKGYPVAIITERDITKQVIKGSDAMKKPVRQFMSKPLIVGTPAMSTWEAFELMVEKRIRRLPIIDQNRLEGIVTEKDLMRWVLRVSYEPNIPDHIKAMLEPR